MKPNNSPDPGTLLDGLREDLQRLPIYRHATWCLGEANRKQHAFDALGELFIAGSESPLRWGVEIKHRSLEPREAELLGARLAEVKADHQLDGVMVLAPYVSEAAAEALAQRGIGYWDASGNCRIWSGALYIERKGFPNRFARQASQGSPFTRVGLRLLRPLLDPQFMGRGWTLRELAQAAHPHVSLGQAQALAKALEQRNHLDRRPDGLRVRNPEQLLRAWAREAKPAKLAQLRGYSMHSQVAFRKAFEGALPALGGGGKALLASYSAASELAPFVRQHRSFLYWSGPVEPLLKALALEVVPDGENVVVTLDPDAGVYYGWEPGQPPVTCPVQTFVDLMQAGGRGEEAAEHLFDQRLKPRYGA